jgi:methionyl-tRNA formyltransferase
MKILFMGSPDFAVPSLNALIINNYNVVGVVTQIDRPKGRGHVLKPTPVKEYALAHNIPVFQPINLSKEPDTISKLKLLEPDLTVTCAFGQILSREILDIPKYGTINVHASLLPKYRGAAPIQWAIINGEQKTGITTMMTDIGLDTGDILLTDEVEITDDMTAGELHDIMSETGPKTLIRTIQALENGTLKRIKQDESLATYAPKISKVTGMIRWDRTTREIHNLIRGTDPWPGAYCEFNGSRVKFSQSHIPDNLLGLKDKPEISDNVSPGTILKVSNEGMWVKTGDGAILIRKIQVGSLRKMTPWQYACGHKLKEGMMFNSVES